MTNIRALRQAGISGRRMDFNLLVKAHYENAYKTAYGLTNHREDAEDLVQETFLRAFRFFDTYDPNSPFEAWLNKIMKNAWIDEYRKSAKYKNSNLKFTSLDDTIKTKEGEVAIEVADDSLRPDEVVLLEERREQVKKALAELKPEFRDVLVLADIDGKSYEEIAKITNTNIGTVRSRIHRARNMIKEKLKD